MLQGRQIQITFSVSEMTLGEDETLLFLIFNFT